MMKHSYTKNMLRSRRSSGQMLLITLLVLAIATTIALSVIGRTATDLNISTQLEESSRAFNAAEAGIEQALKLQSAPNSGALTTLAGGASYQVTGTTIAGTSGTYAFPNLTADGQSETLWLIGHNSDGTLDYSNTEHTNYDPTNNLTVCWGTGGLEVVAYYLDNAGNYQVARQAYDSDSSRSDTNHFNSHDVINNGCSPDDGTSFRQIIAFDGDFGIHPAIDTLIMLRLLPFYTNGGTQLAVSSAVTIPSQGNSYESCGTTGSGVKRCINVYQNFATPPVIADYVLYSGSDLTGQ